MSTVVDGLVLPAGLEALVMRCLAKNPDARWASMEDLVTALSQCSAAPPVRAALHITLYAKTRDRRERSIGR